MKPSGLTVSVAPHIHCGNSIKNCLYNQILALVPAAAVGVYFFGTNAVKVIAVAIFTAVVFDLIMRKALKRPMSVADGHAVLVGLLFALLMPANAPLWAVATGVALAIVIAKWLFGGLGSYPFSPALIGFLMVSVSWNSFLTRWPAPHPITQGAASALPIETKLEMLKRYGNVIVDQFPITDALIGSQAGGIGAVAGLALILGGVYLIARGFISWHIPAGYILGILLMAGIFRYMDPITYGCPFVHLTSGMTLIGAFFIATDYSSSPNTPIGKFVYGLGIGLLTITIRIFGKYPDGTAYAIMLMTLTTPILDRIRPKVIGLVKEAADV